jgi:hypothetical protein
VLDAALASRQDKQVDDAMHRVAALMPLIFSLTATTRDGLAVQAAAAASACRELWDDAGGWATSEHPSWEVERPFIEAVCRYTGVAHPVVPDAPPDAPAPDQPTLATAAITDPDPIFALIEAHRAAFAVFSEASKIADEIPFDRAQPERARVMVGYDTDGELVKGVDNEGPFFRWKRSGKKNPTYAYSIDDIERSAPKELDEQAKKAWIDERTQEFTREEERAKNEYAQTEESKLEAASEAASAREWNLLHELIETIPSTPGGLTALLAYVRNEPYVRDQVIGYGSELSSLGNTYLWTMERIACAAAGLPEPPEHDDTSRDDA